MISIVTGKPGTGKSYTLLLFAKEFLENGEDVFANFRIDETKLQLTPKPIPLNRLLNLFRRLLRLKPLPESRALGTLYYWTDLKEFRQISEANILMDEAQTYFSARRWKEMTIEDEIKFQQHRKQGIDIYAGVQNMKRTDTVIRELAAVVFVMKRIGRLMIRKSFVPEDIEKAKRESLGIKIYWLNPKIADAYNTRQMINTQVEDSAKSNFRRMDSLFDRAPLLF